MMRTSGHLLEWPELKNLIARYIAGPLGRAELEQLGPSSDRPGGERALAETAEAMEFARTAGRPPLSSATDIFQSVQKLRIEGAGLDGGGIAQPPGFLQG